MLDGPRVYWLCLFVSAAALPVAVAEGRWFAAGCFTLAAVLLVTSRPWEGR